MNKNDKSLYFYRKKQKLSQVEFAKKLGIKRYYLSFLETKKILPDIKLAERISTELKTTIGQLWTEKELDVILDRG